MRAEELSFDVAGDDEEEEEEYNLPFIQHFGLTFVICAAGQ